MNGQMKNIPMEQVRFIGNIRDADIEIDELASSIKYQGLLQPVVVSQTGEGYNLIAGHRRFRACTLLGWTEIPAVIRDFENNRAVQLTENIQRKEMTKLEESTAVYNLMKDIKVNKSRLGKILGRNPNWIDKRLSFYEVREFLLGAGILPLKLIDTMSFDIAKIVSKYNRKYWLQLCSNLLGKRWLPEQIRAYCESVTNPNYKPAQNKKPGNKSEKRTPEPGSDNKIILDLLNSEEDEFSIVLDKKDLVIKLMFPTDKGFKTVSNILQKVGGEIL